MAVGTTQEGTIFVAGAFRPARSGATVTVLEKATGEALAEVGAAGVEDVAPVMAVGSEEEAVALVNDSTCLDEAHVPFGGLGASGLGGRAGGESNLEEFTERRWVSLQRARSAYLC
jgi:benzaldehyde dehydrogenase (NAD)